MREASCGRIIVATVAIVTSVIGSGGVAMHPGDPGQRLVHRLDRQTRSYAMPNA